MGTASGGFTADPGLLCLAMVSRFHGVPADPAALAHDLALERPASSEDLIRAGRRLGLRVRWARFDLEAILKGRVSFPVVVECQAAPRAGPEDSPDPGAAQEQTPFLVVAGAQERRLLVHDPLAGRPIILDEEAFQARMPVRALHVATRATALGTLARFDFTWFIPALVKYRALILETLGATLTLQLLALATPLLFQVVMDKVLVHQGVSTLTVVGIGMLAVAVFEATLGAVRAYLFAHTASRIDVELGSRLVRHLVNLPLAYFEARRVGDSVARVRELESIRQFLTGPALLSLLDLLFVFVFVSVMALYSLPLTGLVVASIPVYAALVGLTMPVLRRRLEERFTRSADAQAFLVETVTNVHTLKAAALEPFTARRWDEQLAAYVASSFRVTRIIAIAGEAIQFVQKVVTVGILWIGAYQVMDHTMTIGALVAFNMLATRVTQPIIRLAQLWQEFQQTGISVARLGDILNTRSEVDPHRARAQLPAIRGEVVFEDVCFRYRPDGSETLRGVSFQVRAGGLLGIVGRSGSGKSTVARLLQRLHAPARGRILVDGVDLALADTAWLRRQVSVVLQENRLFARSIRENIALADPGAPMDAVLQAARLAGAHDFILELPEGYDTRVGELGATLSGGQRQRIAIARALLTNPRILILDEATSSLDYESERVIQDNMRAIAQGRTVIVIAHRLSAVREADRILVLDHGQVVEEGTHAELIQKPLGRYARLHQLQAG